MVLPWYAKIGAKIVLSRLPIPLMMWQRLNLFRAGKMDEEDYARGIFRTHLEAAGLTDLTGKTVLELGPGNALSTARRANDLGAEHTWLIDCVPLAKREAIPNATYLTDGLNSLQTLPNESVDFLFSNAVLEHVRLAELDDTITEMRRLLKPGGVATHCIDFRDHLQESLNSYRFSVKAWESRLMASSGFYTNRVPWPDMKRRFERGGFSVSLHSSIYWDSLPLLQAKMSEPFSLVDPMSLLCSSCLCVLR